MTNNFQEKANFIWTVADDVLRGSFKAHEYGDVILPFVVLRRLDLVLEPHKDDVIAQHKEFKDLLSEEQIIPVLNKAAGDKNFYNQSFYDLRRLGQDAGNIELNFNNYLNGYSKNVREIIENFQLEKIVVKLAKNDLLFRLVDMFTEVDLSPSNVTNHEMGYIFEDLLRRFSEMSNETAGEHYTPREVIRLMVSLLLAEHKHELQGQGIIRSVYDPAAGTGGMLITAKEYIHNEINPDLEVVMYGQELNEQTYAIAKSDVLIMGENAGNIRQGNSFSKDQFKGQKFSYMLSNPPFGVSWAKEETFIKNEAADPHGRFFAGTPRSSDGALLFLQHMISKMEAGGSRIAIIFNGSPLFTGDAGSGESDIRKWIIENDMLEAVVAMPTEMFYNTGIATYIFIVTNRKPERRAGKVQLINAVDYAAPMRKNLGNKRQYFTEDHIRQITEIYQAFLDNKVCKVFDNTDFGYTKVTVERPLKDANGKVEKDKTDQPKPDASLRDTEKIPLKDDIDAYFTREVRPHVPEAWMDREKDIVGYDISFTKYFYEYKPLRKLAEIKADILNLEAETEGLLGEISGLMEEYPAYKDSGVEAIGIIPETWEIIKAKYLFHLVTDKAPENNDMELLSVYTEIGVKPRKELEQRGNKASTTDDYWIVKKGDIIVNKILAWMGAIGYSAYDGVTSPAYDVLRASVPLNSRFYHYLFRCGVYLPEFKRRSRGIMEMRLRLYFDELGQIPLVFPPLPEQQIITDFLDRKTAQIDRLIAKKQRQIDLLQEQRTALINQVVTKGLNPSAPLKDSGVEWLGEIPSHWEVVKLKYIGKAFIGLTYNPENVTDEENGTLVFRASNVQDEKIVFDDNVYVKMEIPERLITKVGDILICVRSGSRDLIGKNALIDEKSAGHAFGAFMTVFRSDINYFLSYVFKSQLFKVQSGIFNTSTVNQLTQGSLYSFQVAIPPIDEQEEIIQFLNDELAQIDETTNRVATQIELLQEYRTALISEAVTGKIDVMGEK